MKIQLLPSTFADQIASPRQHLSCFVVDDRVAIDAGSLAMATNPLQKKQIRDVILTHAHLDHIAGLPLFIDDLFADIDKPVEVYGTREMVKILRDHIFNWDIYPNFEKLKNDSGEVLKFVEFEIGTEFKIEHLSFVAFGVNHKVPAVGFLISDENSRVAFTGDTAEMDSFWDAINHAENLDALMIECAFPDRLDSLAEVSFHITPSKLKVQLEKFKKDCPVYVVNIKPIYFEEVVNGIRALNNDRINILEVGRVYEF